MRRTAIAALVAVSGACAGSTLQSGVGDRLIAHPPYYAGQRLDSALARVGHLPVSYQPGASQDALFDPTGGAGTPIWQLLAEMNAYLNALGKSLPLTSAVEEPRGRPDVRFGCETDAAGDCERDEAFDVRSPQLHLSIARPRREWVTWLNNALDGARVSHALMLTLEVGQYWTRQRNLRGSKEVELGTDYVVSVPWLTSLETPVSVLQLTGALVDGEGRAIRIGAEGMLARRTNLLLSSEGGQVLITDEDVAALRALRRDDLPQRPLVWQVALSHLVAELTGTRP